MHYDHNHNYNNYYYNNNHYNYNNYFYCNDNWHYYINYNYNNNWRLAAGLPRPRSRGCLQQLRVP